MFSIFKTAFKTTLIGTAVLGAMAGGALLVAGPARTKAVLHDVKTKVTRAIDARLDDPVQLRNKLRDLEREYPRRIANLRTDLAELLAQTRQLGRERAISLRVVELADGDLAVLRPKLQEAVAAAGGVGAGGVGNGRARLAAIAFDDKVYSLQRASAKVRNAENTRMAHANRAADAEHSLTYLSQQAARFQEVLGQLETEQAEFQVQLFQLNRQVDSIHRNERLIEMLADRKRTLEECSSFEVVSLEQITGKLQQILTRQEAELDVLSSVQDQVQYEDLAREQLVDEAAIRHAVDAFEMAVPVPLERVVR